MTDENNLPPAPPTPPEPEEQNLVTAPVSVSFGQGLAWLNEAWALFVARPGFWVALAVVLFALHIAMAMVPIIGNLASSLLSPVFIAGVVLAAKSLDDNQEPALNMLFAGFSDHFGQLVLVAAIYLALTVIMVVLVMVPVAFMLGMGAVLSEATNMQSGQMDPAMAFSVLMAVLIIFALMVPVLMAYWFAPALVMLEGRSAVDAMKASFKGCLKNVMPFLLYGVLSIIFAILAMLPFFLGLLIFYPVIMITIYTSYKDIYRPALS